MDNLIRAWRWILILMGLCVFDLSSQAQQPARECGTPAFLDDARKYVIESIKDKAKRKLNEKSLLNWTNPTRQQEREAIYVWTQEDRPLAIGSLFTYEYNNKVYLKHEFHSFSTGALNASYDGTTAWTPKDAGIKWQDFVDSLAPRPLFEYASPKAGIIEGVIFSFGVATDPEVLLLLEAFEENRDATVRLARMTFNRSTSKPTPAIKPPGQNSSSRTCRSARQRS